MSDVGWALAVLFPLLLLVGLPIYAALGITGLAVTWLTGTPLLFGTQSILNGLDNFPLLAIPAFILAGNLMEAGGITGDIIRIFRRAFGHIPGSLGIVTILSCMFFAAISGSGPGTVAAIGAIMIPAMIQRGYPAPFAAATSATGGTLGVLIPPSNPMIIYAIIANVSVIDLFAAGMLPGLIVGLTLALVAYLVARRAGAVMQPIGDEDEETASVGRLVWQGKWAVFMPILILGGIYSGIFTPVEASVVAVAYALVVSLLVYRTMTWRGLLRAFDGAVLMGGALMIVVATSTLFARTITLERIPQELVEVFGSVTTEPLVILLMINVLLLVIGTFMETISAIIILAPILVPLVRSFGIDPVHFGIILIINIEIAFLTPPLGVNLFVGAQIAGVSIERVFRAILPFIGALVALLALITLVPQLSLFVPSLLR
ncbi:TRAP transporter large permease [Acuticoccus sp.]|uniref:TRAP transporter large permease n=1 Tax=Acuticoccus sp. TaxID=1904378 RepID=UPI003B52A956